MKYPSSVKETFQITSLDIFPGNRNGHTVFPHRYNFPFPSFKQPDPVQRADLAVRIGLQYGIEYLGALA